MRAVARELEVGVPRHGRDGAMEKRVGVVEESGIAWIFQRCQSAAGSGRPIHRQDFQSRLAQVSLQDEPVVAGAHNDEIVIVGHLMPDTSNPD